MGDDFPPEARGRFPATRRSAVLAVGSDDPIERARSFDILARAYWKPVYLHLRGQWKHEPEQAQDVTQGFFARAFEKRWFADYDPAKALFRTYLKTCLDRFAMDAARSEQRQKRGGDTITLSLDFDAAEGELQRLAAPQSPDACFDEAWVRSLLGDAVDVLRETCKEGAKATYFTVFQKLVLDRDDGPRPSYAALAAELSLSVSDVTNYLAWSRREFRRIVLERLRDITATEEEFRSEARTVLGIDP